MVGAGLAVASRMSSARALPGPRQESCCGVAVVPDKDLAGGLVGFPGKDLAEVHRLLILF